LRLSSKATAKIELLKKIAKKHRKKIEFLLHLLLSIGFQLRTVLFFSQKALQIYYKPSYFQKQ